MNEDAPTAADTDLGDLPAQAREQGSPDWLSQHTRTATDRPAAVPQADSALGLDSIGRTSVGLLVVIGLILVCGALLKRFGPYRKYGDQSLDVVASQSLGPRERVVVVEIDDTWLVLGVTSNNVNTLHTMPARERPAPEDGPVRARNPSFREALSENLRRAGSRFSREPRR